MSNQRKIVLIVCSIAATFAGVTIYNAFQSVDVETETVKQARIELENMSKEADQKDKAAQAKIDSLIHPKAK